MALFLLMVVAIFAVHTFWYFALYGYVWWIH